MAQTLIWIMDDGQTIDVSGTGHIITPPHAAYKNAGGTDMMSAPPIRKCLGYA